MRLRTFVVPAGLHSKITQKLGVDPNPIEDQFKLFRLIKNLLKRLNEPTNAEFIQKNIAHDYSKYFKWLRKHKIIYIAKNHSEEKSRVYAFNPVLMNGEFVKHQLPIPKLIFKQNRRKRERIKKLDHMKAIEKLFKSLTIDEVKANEEIETYLPESKKIKPFDRRWYDNQCVTDFNEDKRMQRNDTNNRLDSNLTNMSSYLLKFIKQIEGYKQEDLSNSQPLLVNPILDSCFNISFFNKSMDDSLLYVSRTIKQNLLKDLDKSTKEILLQMSLKSSVTLELSLFKNVTSNGTFYEYLETEINKALGKKIITRNHAKMIWMLVAYSKNSSYKQLKELFKLVFPNIYEVIHLLKEHNDYQLFSVTLQQIESYLFIDVICKELVENGITPLTKHDSCIVKPEEIAKTKEIIKTVIGNVVGTSVTTKTEAINEIKYKEKVDTNKMIITISKLIKEQKSKKKASVDTFDHEATKVIPLTIKKPAVVLIDVLNEFVSKDRAHFIREIGRNKVIHDKLVEVAGENDLKKLYNEFGKYWFMEKLKYEFFDFYNEYLMVTA